MNRIVRVIATCVAVVAEGLAALWRSAWPRR